MAVRVVVELGAAVAVGPVQEAGVVGTVQEAAVGQLHLQLRHQPAVCRGAIGGALMGAAGGVKGVAAQAGRHMVNSPSATPAAEP